MTIPDIAQPARSIRTELRSETIADAAVRAMSNEARLQPKPGLVDPRDSSAHDDMTVTTLLASAEALRSTFVELVHLTADRTPNLLLRAQVGAVGRAGEQRMLAATGGVNTHRGALWALGLLACGAANSDAGHDILEYSAALARLPDSELPRSAIVSHGAAAARRYHVPGARGEAQAGFPHVRRALRTLRRERSEGRSSTHARMTALVELIAHVDDTCLLHRGGAVGLRAMQQAARRVLEAGGPSTAGGRIALSDLDHLARDKRLSPGGSGDLLSAAMFLDELTRTADTMTVGQIAEAR